MGQKYWPRKIKGVGLEGRKSPGKEGRSVCVGVFSRWGQVRLLLTSLLVAAPALRSLPQELCVDYSVLPRFHRAHEGNSSKENSVITETNKAKSKQTAFSES